MCRAPCRSWPCRGQRQRLRSALTLLMSTHAPAPATRSRKRASQQMQMDMRRTWPGDGSASACPGPSGPQVGLGTATPPCWAAPARRGGPACCRGMRGVFRGLLHWTADVRVDGDMCKMVQPVPWTPTPAAPAPWAALSSSRSSAWDHSHSPCWPIHHFHAVCQPHMHIAPHDLTLPAP